MTSLQCLKQASHELSLPLRYGNSTRNYVVRVGDYHTLVPEEFEEEIRVEQIVTHRLYRPHSNDYDIAIEEGSNLVRIGSKIFGPRIYR